MIKDQQDAYGHEVYDYLKRSRPSSEIVERDDGYVDISSEPPAYFSRYRRYATPWFNYLIVSKREMGKLLKGTGWKISKTFDGKRGTYIAVIEKIA